MNAVLILLLIAHGAFAITGALLDERALAFLHLALGAIIFFLIMR